MSFKGKEHVYFSRITDYWIRMNSIIFNWLLDPLEIPFQILKPISKEGKLKTRRV